MTGVWGGAWLRYGVLASVAAFVLTLSVQAGEPAAAGTGGERFVGRWALTFPWGAAGWLGVEKREDGSLQGSLLWGEGSVLPVAELAVRDDALSFVRRHQLKKDGRDIQHVETVVAKISGAALSCSTRTVDDAGNEITRAEFRGVRIPDLPPRPDLKKVRFGSPLQLFNGKDLAGWTVMDEQAPNYWCVTDGLLCNRVRATEGARRNGTNIRTERVFEDFNLKTEVRLPPNGNSGIFLRGIYEVQVTESYGKPLLNRHMGALYSRITPSVNAERPAGEWQTLDITLVRRHLTVVLNGTTIIDNQPVVGCTGGAMTSDEGRPGPIYLQGDHTDVDYRYLVLTPVVSVAE